VPTPASENGERAELLRLEGICKAFGGAPALEDVDLSLNKGEIHGLVGENGAGKSTLIKIITGAYTRDTGSLLVDGEPQGQLTPSSASALGIEVIHQDRQLVPHFTVAETLALGKSEPRRLGMIARRELNGRAEEVLTTWLASGISPTATVSDLSVAQQQHVQIARALAGNPRVLVLDEPTAPLSRDDVDRLFEILRDLRSRGIAMIYISHHLREVTAICDRVTVLRNGCNAGSLDVGEQQVERQLIRLMVGREVESQRVRRTAPEPGDELLRVADVTVPGALTSVSLSLRQREIIGVTGLVGSGTRELVRAVAGLLGVGEGEIEFPRADGAGPATRPAFVPEDRRGEGAVLDMSVQENITLASLREHSRRGLLNGRRERATARDLIERLDIRPPRADAGARYLSGGNQQKVVLGRWLAASPDVYVLDQPTAGVDLGARADIHRMIDEVVGEGAAVLVVTYDLDELFRLADSVIVMYRGAIVAHRSADQLTHETVLELATGAAAHVDELMAGHGNG
jgi:ribose transport system ATP-binding protein